MQFNPDPTRSDTTDKIATNVYIDAIYLIPSVTKKAQDHLPPIMKSQLANARGISSTKSPRRLKKRDLSFLNTFDVPLCICILASLRDERCKKPEHLAGATRADEIVHHTAKNVGKVQFYLDPLA